MKKKTIDERLRSGKDLPSMDELEDDFAKKFGIGLMLLALFVIVLIIFS